LSNRLSAETSPYLLQHADNPVDWFAWGDEAFATARQRDVPILLSIGYSACHWCHVMERESFEDPDAAEVMNALFVNVKVDREERPDVDSIYMRAVQSLTGHGGWPLTVFLTPDGRPYYGGTYFPPEPRHGMPSFQQVIRAAADAYQNRRDQVERSAAQIHDFLERTATESDSGPQQPAAEGGATALMDHAVKHLASEFDEVHGGLGSAPKFPQPDTLEFLLRAHLLTSAPQLLEMVVHSLTQMARGGIYDHLGGGFHRYSVDARWLVPHFEKMLYDNGLLARLYTMAFQSSGVPLMREVAEGTLDYVLSDLRSPEGALFSARDADSEGEEGVFYVWDEAEVLELLGPERGPMFARYYDVTRGGNFEGRNILHSAQTPESFAQAEGMDPTHLASVLSTCRESLLAHRAEREAPFRDEKVLLSWNAMSLRALAESGAVLSRPDYVEAAREGCAFILDRMRPEGRLLHTFKDGIAKVDGFLEDYGALGNALLTLHGVTLEARWLEEARWTVERMLTLFWDDEEGLFWDTSVDGEQLVVRPRNVMDNATPSGNSLAVELLFRAGHIFGEPEWIERATRTTRREAGGMQRFPAAFGRLFSASMWLAQPPREIVIVGDPAADHTQALITAAWQAPRNSQVIAGGPPADLPEGPLFDGRLPMDGKATAYVCERFSCMAPVTTPEELTELLK
jgi:uncharacterized protein